MPIPQPPAAIPNPKITPNAVELKNADTAGCTEAIAVAEAGSAAKTAPNIDNKKIHDKNKIRMLSSSLILNMF
jgi:hypothetical protein